MEKLQKKAEKVSDVPQNHHIEDENLNDFTNKSIGEWTKLLEDKIDNDARSRIIEPLLCKSAQMLLKKVGKAIRNYHLRRKENLLWDELQQNKKQFENEKDQHEFDNINEIIDKYDQNLLIVLAKTKNPKLFADIIREGAPMDMVCIYACAIILNKPIKIVNSDGITFPDLICPSGFNQANIQDKDCLLIYLHPGNGNNLFGHFTSPEHIDGNFSNDDRNNCLIRALLQQLPKDKNSTNVKNFREKIANEIERNANIHEIIKQGHHRFFISQFGFGGQHAAKTIFLRRPKLTKNLQMKS